MSRKATLTAVLLLLAAGLWFVLTQRDAGLPNVPSTGAAGAQNTAAGARGEVATAATSTPDERRDALVPTPPHEPAFTVVGTVLADPHAPDLSAVQITAFRGEEGDQANSFMSAMSGGMAGRRTAPGSSLVLIGEPIARTAVDAGGHFVLRTDERHLRLRLEDDVYVLPMPEIVHIAATESTTAVVLSPVLGGCVRGQLLGERRDEVTEVRLLLDADPMSVMRDNRLFLGAMTAAMRPVQVPDTAGTFVFRGVLPGAAITLSAAGAHCNARVTQAGLEPGERRDVALPMRNAASLRIQVNDAGGTAIKDAEIAVRSLSLTGMTTPQLLARRGKTGPDGVCLLEGLAAERSRIEAEARGFTAFSTSLDLQPTPPEQSLQITLAEGGTVEGTVFAPDGKPLAGAHVAHQPSIDVPVLGDMTNQIGAEQLQMVANGGVATDADGRFRLTGLADDGEFLVVAAHPDYAAGVARSVHMGDRSVKVTLQALGTVTGHVVAADDAAPLHDFTVALLRTSFVVMRIPVRRQPFADSADGGFTLDHIAPGSYTLQISSDGRSDTQKDIEVAGADLDVGNLELALAASIRGKVIDEQGRPVAFALVRKRQGAMADNPMLAMFASGTLQARSDANGAFVLAPMSPGRLQLLATAEGFASGRSERLQLAAGQQLEGVVITLGHGGSIQGRLIVGPGQQVDDFLLMAQEQGTQASQMATIAADGSFTIDNLDPGQYSVQAMPQGLMRSFSQTDWKPGQPMKFGEMFQKITDQVVSRRVAVRAGEASEVTLDASDVSSGLRWTLTVEVGGQPLDAAFVETTTLADGRVRMGMLQKGTAVFGGMHPGAQRVQVRSGMAMTPIGPAQTVELPAGTDSHHSTLSLPGGELRGRVVDATTGKPLRSALVRLLHDGKSENDDALGMALTDAQGEFHFGGLTDGSYSLLAVDGLLSQRDATASRRSGIVVASGQASELVELRAQPAAAASVLVTTSGGAPLLGATVLCVDADGHPLGTMGLATSGADGRATFGGMPRGAVRVVGRAPGFAPAASELQEVSPDHATDFQLTLPTGTRTTLQAFDRAGHALVGATLTARCDNGPWLPSLLLIEGMRSDGGFELGRLGRGNWEFRITHPSTGTLTQQRAIGDETSVTVVIAAH